MANKRVVLAVLGGAFLVAVCLLLLKNSVSQLPPSSVKPSSKPAFAQVGDKSTMKVNAAPASQKVDLAASAKTPQSLTSNTDSSSVTKPSNCDQTASSSGPEASVAMAKPARLTSIPDVLNQLSGTTPSAPKTLLGSGLQTPLLNVAGSLSE